MILNILNYKLMLINDINLYIELIIYLIYFSLTLIWETRRHRGIPCGLRGCSLNPILRDLSPLSYPIMATVYFTMYAYIYVCERVRTYRARFALGDSADRCLMYEFKAFGL